MRSPDPALASRVCEVAVKAAPQLAACHLPHTTTLHFVIHDVLQHDGRPCLGEYDCEAGEISIATPHRLAATVPETSAFSRISSLALFDSLVVHEMAHALIDQNACEGRDCVANQEYIAYALQIDSLSERDRATLAAGIPPRTPSETTHLNPVMVAFAPDHFAVWAWQHFSALGHGCDFVAALLNGTVRLEMPPL